MTRFRVSVLVLAAVLSVALVVGAAGASAQAPSPLTKTLPVTGRASDGKRFIGTYTIQRFVKKAGRAYAVGTLRGTLGSRRVSRRDVRMPSALGAGPGATGAQLQQPLPTPGACPVLNLVLGPINLNLLGVRVATNQIRALIEAVPGAGNLLGNLLCAVTNLLNPSSDTPLSQVVRVLNALLALVPQAPTSTSRANTAAVAAGAG